MAAATDQGLAASIKPFTFPTIGNTAPSYENIIKMLSTPTPNQSDYMGEIGQILGQRSEYLKPAIQGMQQQGEMGAADLMGAMNKRGLAGGSIEAQGLATHYGNVQANISQALANVAMQNSQVFAQLLSQARTGDVNAQRQLMQMIAQAMGEELTAQRDMSMWQQELAAGMETAARQRRQGMLGSALGAVGAVGGGVVGGIYGGPMGAAAGASIGGAAGNAAGSYMGNS